MWADCNVTVNLTTCLSHTTGLWDPLVDIECSASYKFLNSEWQSCSLGTNDLCLKFLGEGWERSCIQKLQVTVFGSRSFVLTSWLACLLMYASIADDSSSLSVCLTSLGWFSGQLLGTSYQTRHFKYCIQCQAVQMIQDCSLNILLLCLHVVAHYFYVAGCARDK